MALTHSKYPPAPKHSPGGTGMAGELKLEKEFNIRVN